MSNVWFCSDLHLGHKGIERFRKDVSSCEENNSRILHELNTHIESRDVLYCLGDWCFDLTVVNSFAEIRCQKKYLVRGNHDEFPLAVYTTVFDDIFGIVKYKHMWLSHAPIHPTELRGAMNLHGHTHYSNKDNRYYLNCCPENLWPKYGRCLVNLDEVRSYFDSIGV